MSDQKKTPSGGNREGAGKCVYPKLTKPKSFPQEPLNWQAYRQSFQNLQKDPTPVNRRIAQVMAAHWQSSFAQEALR
ncbi:MAG: hypothetical protein L6Q57_08845 [Alphaproteobacteria bacterium]|nr:hypothetical protein [Alphaproteobacteria bacterium]